MKRQSLLKNDLEKINKLPRQQSQQKGLKISASISNELNKIDHIKEDKQRDLEKSPRKRTEDLKKVTLKALTEYQRGSLEPKTQKLNLITASTKGCKYRALS